MPHPLTNRPDGVHVCPGGCGLEVPVEDYVCLSCALRELEETRNGMVAGHMDREVTP